MSFLIVSMLVILPGFSIDLTLGKRVQVLGLTNVNYNMENF